MNDSPELVRGCSRRSDRHWLRHAGEAFFEFDDADGRHWRLELLNLSTGGLCFGLDDGKPSLVSGAIVEQAVVRVGEIEVRGSVRVAHVTEEFAAGTICGAEFTPATELDERRMATLVSEIGG